MVLRWKAHQGGRLLRFKRYIHDMAIANNARFFYNFCSRFSVSKGQNCLDLRNKADPWDQVKKLSLSPMRIWILLSQRQKKLSAAVKAKMSMGKMANCPRITHINRIFAVIGRLNQTVRRWNGVFVSENFVWTKRIHGFINLIYVLLNH